MRLPSLIPLLAACCLLASVPPASAAAAAGSDREPVARKRVNPVYPAEMRRLKMTGTVALEFIVDAKGNVVDAWASRSPDPQFSAAAVTAVKKWKFEPGLKDGKPVMTRLAVEIKFDLPPAPAKK